MCCRADICGIETGRTAIALNRGRNGFGACYIVANAITRAHTGIYRVVASLTMQPVITIAAGDAIRAIPAKDRIRTTLAGKRIIARIPQQHIAAAIAKQAVREARTLNTFEAGEGIRTRGRGTGHQIHRDSARCTSIGQQVIAEAAIQAVITRAAIQRIRTIATGQRVIAGIAQDGIIPIEANIGVIARQQVNRVCAIAADKVIIASRGTSSLRRHQALRRNHGRVAARACGEGDKATIRGTARPGCRIFKHQAVITAAKDAQHICCIRQASHHSHIQLQQLAATRQINRLNPGANRQII